MMLFICDFYLVQGLFLSWEQTYLTNNSKIYGKENTILSSYLLNQKEKLMRWFADSL